MHHRPQRNYARRAVIALLLVLCCAFTSLGASAAIVSKIEVKTSGTDGVTQVIIDTNSPTQHALIELHNPERVALDLRDSQRLGGNTTQIAGDGVVSRIRTGVRNGVDLRIVVDLKQATKAKLRTLPPDPRYGNRLVLELSTGSVASATKTVATAATVHDRAPVTSAAPSVAPTVAPTVTKHVAEAVTVPPLAPTEKTFRPRISIVAIDAGHGGVDHGARGARGTREKDVALAISRKLAARVNREPGMKAVLVRDGDYFIPLRDRMVRARRKNADLFVSIHADAHTNRRARGASVFVLSNNGASSEHAKWLAGKENSADLIGGVSIRDKSNGLASFMLDLSQDAAMEASMDVAGRVLRQLGGIGNLHKRSVQRAGFMVLKSPDIPSILVETAFISNRSEEARLRDQDYQTRLASAIFGGVKGYFAMYRPARSSTVATADQR